MSKSPKISIVLPTYNRLYSLRQFFLPSLERQEYSEWELVVVDDNSLDETEHFFEKEVGSEYPKIFERIVYLKNDENKGAPESRNVGAAKARANWIYIVEDDVEIKDEKFLSKAIGILEAQDKSTAVVSPKRQEGLNKGYYRNPAHNLARVGVLSGEVYLDPDQEYSGFVPTTHASSFFRTEIFLRFKEDSKTFFGNTFRDETDIYKRITDAGFKIYYCGDILKTKHRNDVVASGGQKKINSNSIFKQETMVWKNHYLFLKKYYILALIMMIFFIIVRAFKVLSQVTRLRFLRDFLTLVRL